jgi:hypothetical protein
VAWPPAAEDLYLADPGARAPFQGDIYEDVPFTKAASGNDVESGDPSWSCQRRLVATLLYPCDMVAHDNVTLVRAQSVAVVCKMPPGLTLPPDWNGAYKACPLPDLMGDGEMWMVDFTKTANIDRDYLRPDHRVRALSELGWGFFRQRLILAATRLTTDIDKFIELGAATWAESELEAEWISKGGTKEGFQRWLDAYDPALDSLSRRAALDGQKNAVRDALNTHLIAPS